MSVLEKLIATELNSRNVKFNVPKDADIPVFLGGQQYSEEYILALSMKNYIIYSYAFRSLRAVKSKKLLLYSKSQQTQLVQPEKIDSIVHIVSYASLSSEKNAAKS